MLNRKGVTLDDYRPWLTCIRALTGRKITSKYGRELVQKCMGVDASTLPRKPRKKNLLLVGRRGGKSFLASLLGAHIAVFSGKERYLARSEVGMVAIIAPSKKQARKTMQFLRMAFDAPMLKQKIVNETANGFLLSNNVEVSVLTGNPSLVRGWSLLAAIVDECCHFQTDAEEKKTSDVEIIRAVTPGLLNARGSLYAISSPYIEDGWAYRTWERCWGKPDADTFVWRADCLTMNPTLTLEDIEEEMAADPEAARSEFFAEWRQSISAWLSREEVLAAVAKGRRELMPRRDKKFVAYIDIASGAARGDDAVAAVGRREGGKVILYKLIRYRPPFNPLEVIRLMCRELKNDWGIQKVTGDFYGGQFTPQTFAANGIRYRKAELNSSQLLNEFGKRLRSNEVELLDDEDLIKQACQLVRKCTPGQDVEKISHPAGGHDDLVVATAGLVQACASPKRRVGAFSLEDDNRSSRYDDQDDGQEYTFVPRPFLQ